MVTGKGSYHRPCCKARKERAAKIPKLISLPHWKSDGKNFNATYNLLSDDYFHCPKMQSAQQMCPYAT